MSYRDLLVVLDSDAAARVRIEFAAAIAERFAAHLAGLYPLPMPQAPRYFAYYDPALLNPFFEELRARARDADAADKTRQEFERIASLRGVSAEWREIPEGTDADPALHARYADLTILGQFDPDEPDTIRPRPEQVTLVSGRPILVVPYAVNFVNLGRRVVIGWNASQEAARAVNDAMPLLTAAETDTVLTIDPRERSRAHGELPGRTSRSIWRATVSRRKSSARSQPICPSARSCSRVPPISAPIYW